MNLMQKLRGEMETDRLLLRKWKRPDFEHFVKFASDPEVMLPAGGQPANTLEEAETEFRRALRDDGCYAIVLKETGAPIGKIKFQSDPHRQNHVGSLSIGYQLAREYWGNGYMPEALRAMVANAFEKKKVPVLGISHFTENHRSRRVIEKCGFRHEGTLPRAYRRFDGQLFDDECYSILREEYLAEKEKYLSGAADGLPAGEMEGKSGCSTEKEQRKTI